MSDPTDSPPGRNLAPFGGARPTLSDRLANVLLRLIANLHIWTAWQLEWILSVGYAFLSLFLRSKPRTASAPERSAIVIMGGGEGIGRMLCLKFAGAGYTVFACLPHDVPTPRGTLSSSSISPLLYIWQRWKAKTEQNTRVGSIVPLVFDASIPDEFDRAMDTVRAYCERHGTRLVSVIVPPISPSPVSSESGQVSPLSSTLGGTSSGSFRWRRKRNLFPAVQLAQTNEAVLHEAMSRSIFQPLRMVNALTELLKSNQSQVLFLSGCDETSFRPSQGLNVLLESARETTASTLSTELRSEGIQVSLVTTGPHSGKAAALARIEFPAVDESRKILALISLLWAIDDSTCFLLLKQVVESKYPRATYRFGLDLLTQDFLSIFIPGTLRDLGKKLAAEKFGIAA